MSAVKGVGTTIEVHTGVDKLDNFGRGKDTFGKTDEVMRSSGSAGENDKRGGDAVGDAGKNESDLNWPTLSFSLSLPCNNTIIESSLSIFTLTVSKISLHEH